LPESAGGVRFAGIGKKRWTGGTYPMFLLAAVNLVDQTDIGIMRGVLPIIDDEWEVSDFQLGLLGFAFIFVNTIATIPAGWIADRVRRTNLIGWTLLSWSGLILLSATAVNYWNLVFARSVMGIGQSIDDPASTSLLADYYPAEQRGRAISLQQVTLFLGGALGVGLGGLVGDAFGWRWAFVVVGMPGSLVALLMFRLREPARGESDGAVRTELPPRPPVSELFRSMVKEIRGELKVIFGIRTMRYILVGVGALLFTVSGIFYWLAVYHDRYSGLTDKEASGVTAGIVAVGGLIGTFGGGWLSDRYHTRMRGGRVVLVVYGAGACAALFVASFAVPWVPLRVLLQVFGVIGGASAIPGIRAAMLDVIPVDNRGVGASAFALTAAIFGTALAPVLVGALSDLTSLVWAFTIVLPPVLFGLFFLLRARDTINEDAAALIRAVMQSSDQLG
jgi:MFS family permease